MGEAQLSGEIAGRFAIATLAAAGGMGRVYRAHDRVTGVDVALKVLTMPEERGRFDREIRLLASLDHPGIPKYVAHGITDAGQAYLAMEWVEGETLATRLRRAELTLEESIDLVRRVAETLAAAHSCGVVHRDIKPGNIMLHGGALEGVRLIDFGVARDTTEDASITRTGFLIGTPHYMAPEQARGDRDLTPAADVFALGCVLYRCVTGVAPFHGDSAVAVLAKVLLDEPPRPSETRPELPRALDDLVMSMLSKEPEGRPIDAAAVASKLGAIDSARRSSAAPKSRPTIGAGEARVVSVVFVGPTPSEVVHRLRETASASLGEARTERLRDGSFVVLVSGRGVAADQAASAVATANALHAIVPDAPIVVVTGRAELKGDRIPVGDVIDRASHLMSKTAPGEVRLGPVTAALLSQREADGGGLLLGKPSPFVGRDANLATLEATFRQACEDSVAKCVVVVGAAGMGKSRLRQELVSRLAGDVEIWIARSDPMGAATALGLTVQLLGAAADLHPRDPIDERQRRLRARVSRHVAPDAVDRVTAFLAESIGIPLDDATLPMLHAARRDSVQLGDQIRRAWIDLIDAETAAHPLLIVLEDLHWADRPTVALVDSALSLFGHRPLCVLALARPELDTAFPSLWRDREVQVVRLGPLSRRAAEQLVRSSLGARGDSVATKLAEACGGNAFYLEELIRMAADGRDDALPDTVVAMVQSRLEQLDADDRRLLRAASVFGRVFWTTGVAHLLGDADLANVERRLDTLTNAELVVRRRESSFADHAEFSFRHALLREGAYAMFTDADRALGHRLAGEWLESAGSTEAAVIAEHFERGEDPANAAKWYARAAVQALEGNDLTGVIDLTDRGVELGGEGESLGTLLGIRATALRWLGRFPEAMEAAERAVLLLPEGDPAWAEAQMSRATIYLATGRPADLEALYREVLPIAKGASIAPRVLDVIAHLGRNLLQAGRSALSDELLTLAERHASSNADPALIGRIAYARALHAMYAGETASTLIDIIAAAELLERGGDVRSAGTARTNAGYNYIALGAYADAERVLQAALQNARVLGLTSQAIGASENLGIAVARLGRLEEGADIERQTATLCARNGDLRFEGGARIYLATILLELGKATDAELEARAAVKILEPVPPMQACAFAVLADVLLATSRPEEALVSARRAADLAQSSHVIEEEAPIWLSLALALEATGDHGEALTVITRARGRILDRASRIHDEALRTTFLENVPEHKRTLALAAAWAARAR